MTIPADAAEIVSLLRMFAQVHLGDTDELGDAARRAWALVGEAECTHRVDAKSPSRTTLTVGVYEQDCRLCSEPVRFVLDDGGQAVLATKENAEWRPTVSHGGTS